MAYDPVGAMGGLFAPAYIHGNPESEAATAKWQAENFAVTPEIIEASRGPGKTITNPGVGGVGQPLRGGVGSTTTTIPGSVDPVALQIYAQGGKYTPASAPAPAVPAVPAAAAVAAVPAASGAGAAANPQRDAIAGQIMASGGLRDNQFAGPMGVPLIRQGTGPVPAGYQRAYSPLIGLMGEGDNTGFMQGSFAGGA